MEKAISRLEKELCTRVVCGNDPDRGWESSCDCVSDWEQLTEARFRYLKSIAVKARDNGCRPSMLAGNPRWLPHLESMARGVNVRTGPSPNLSGPRARTIRTKRQMH